jgi:ketosteroid isomerase-like protein
VARVRSQRQGATVLVLALAAAGCRAAPPSDADAPFDDAARAAVEAAVDSATRAFEAAERARDAEAAVAHLAPDFSIFVDGSRVDYEASAEGMRATLPTLAHFEPGWTDLRVQALSPTLAISSFTFNDSIVGEDGTLTRATGPTTLVWEKRGDDWLIVYGDADHYPVEADGGA